MNAQPAQKPTILLTEADVIVRLILAEHLRHCAIVVEAASAQEARAVLVAGPPIDIMIADAQLAGGDETGFALAQWVRRYRPQIEVIMTASVTHKAQAAADFCARYPATKAVETAALSQRIRAMLAERKRRLRPGAPTASALLRRRRR
jgi:DNA-binding response OmpR family regulator